MSGTATTGRRVVLASHPHGNLKASDFKVEDYAVPQPGDGQFLVRSSHISVDPMLRLFVDPAPLGGGMPPLPIGTTIPGAAVGTVIASNNPEFPEGTLVEGRFGWQTHAVSNGAGINRVSAALGDPANALGVGGLPGFTAFCGIEAAGGVKPGQTWLVNGAAGAVGSVLGPMVKAHGGRLVGIAGGESKRAFLLENGYDAVADRHSPDFHQQLKEALPAGADIYFDNVGGPLLADMTAFMARGALVLICGLMSSYQDTPETTGPDRLTDVLRAVMFKGVRIQGFSQAGQDHRRPAFEAEVGSLLASGALKPSLRIVKGIENLPGAMVALFESSTTGKVVVDIA